MRTFPAGEVWPRLAVPIFIFYILFFTCPQIHAAGINTTDTPLIVHQCNNFLVNGKGDNPEWLKTAWIPLTKIDTGGKVFVTQFKILYSNTGIYVLFTGDDEKITSNWKKDFDNLFTADVFEVFFHPLPQENIYFEYEISPLEKELVLLILNRNGRFGGWTPWHYEGDNKVVKKVSIEGGKMKSGAVTKAWTAELFFPYSIFNALQQVPPVSGMRWNANFCRLDYDSGHMIKWSWSPVKISFHEFASYLPIQFE